MATIEEIQSEQSAAIEDIAATVRALAGQFGEQQRAAMEDRLQERLPSDRRSLSPKQQNIGSTVLGNVQPYDLYPGLAANWTFVYHGDGRLDSAWRTGDEGAASIIVHWDSSPKIDWVQVTRGGRRSEVRLVYSVGRVVLVARSFALLADPSDDEFLAYYFLNESRIPVGTFAATPTADYLAVTYL
jgi:hypothetical protein